MRRRKGRKGRKEGVRKEGRKEGRKEEGGVVMEGNFGWEKDESKRMRSGDGVSGVLRSTGSE